ncbi:polysaccharide deacetylase family protein [Streptococcus orisratti]
MKKRNHRRHKPNSFWLILNLFLLFACVLSIAFLVFTLKDRKISLNNSASSTKISKIQNQKVSTTPTNSSKQNTNTDTVEWKKANETVSVPILMYHAIHNIAPEEAANANLIVDPITFESHIQRLAQEGYYFLTPEEAYRVFTENVLPNGNNKIIWLTFDDSLWDFHDIAYPILKKYKAKATNNVITGTVGNSGNLSLEQMLDMKKHGMSFQDHTVNHPDLSVQSAETQKNEMKESKVYLDQNLNQDTIAIAYPAGRYSDTTLELASNLDYKLGVTTNEGIANINNGLLSLNRVRILPTTTADTLLATIS